MRGCAPKEEARALLKHRPFNCGGQGYKSSSKGFARIYIRHGLQTDRRRLALESGDLLAQQAPWQASSSLLAEVVGPWIYRASFRRCPFRAPLRAHLGQNRRQFELKLAVNLWVRAKGRLAQRLIANQRTGVEETA